MKLRLLIDGDILVYRAAYTGTLEPMGFIDEPTVNEKYIESYITDLINAIKNRLFAHNAIIVLSGKDNFRKKIFPEYKANRKKTPPPAGLDYTYEFLHNQNEFEVMSHDMLEADDLIGLLSSDSTYKNVICSIDKDLLQLPGYHFNWKKDTFFVVEPEEACRAFYTQVLTGDSTDGFYGIPRVGPKRANKLLEQIWKGGEHPFTDMEFWIEELHKLYLIHGLSTKEFYQNLLCAYILRGNDFDFETNTITNPYYEEGLKWLSQ